MEGEIEELRRLCRERGLKIRELEERLREARVRIAELEEFELRYCKCSDEKSALLDNFVSLAKENAVLQSSLRKERSKSLWQRIFER